MDLYQLNAIKMKERQYHQLANIPETFYEELVQGSSLLKEGVEVGDTEMYVYTNFCVAGSEIIERRMNKLMNRAYMYAIRNHSLFGVEGGVEVEVPRNAVPVEVVFFKGLLKDFADFYENVGGE